MEVFDITKLPNDKKSGAVVEALKEGLARCRWHWQLVYAKLLASRWSRVGPGFGVDVAATDSRTLYLNFLGLMEVGELTGDLVGAVSFIEVHESLHGLLDHPIRMRKLEHKTLANIAADLIINDLIYRKNKTLKGNPFPMPEGAWHDPELSKDHSLEQLYKILLPRKDEMEQMCVQQNVTLICMPGTVGCEQDVRELVPDAGEDLDTVIHEVACMNEQILIQDQINSQTRSDDGPKGDRIGCDMHRAIAVPWQDRIYEWASSKREEGWMKPQHRPLYCSTGLIAPGRGGKLSLEDLVLVMDSSGSVSREVWDMFLRVTQQIVDDLNFDHVYLLSVSSRVMDVVVLDPGSQVPRKMKGGGGTNFRPAFNWVTSVLDDEVEGLVYLTDGDAPIPEDMEPPYPMLWASYGKPPESYPWGEAVHAY